MLWRSSVDQMGRTVTLPAPPQRIVSLVPSQTELLADLGLDAHVVGITKFCVHPVAWLKTKHIIGGTKNFDPDLIRRLHPDLIIGNKEENTENLITDLAKAFPVWMSDVSSFEQSLEMIGEVGRITNRASASKAMILAIESAFSSVRPFPPHRTLYLIWRKPWMGAGGDTFIHSMLAKLGLINVLSAENRYPILDEDSLRALHPDIVFMPSEPFPFTGDHEREIQLIIPEAKIVRVDGEMFSWYGSRLALAPPYFTSLTGSIFQ